MNRAYLLTGGNIGDRMHFLLQAKELLRTRCGTITRTSGVYETEAWGLPDQDSFLNQALELQTQLTASELLTCLLQIEEELGRRRQQKYGPRLIDIDILFFNNEIIHKENLKVPHPQLAHRRFALQCMADLAPQLVHPVLHKTMQQLLEDCTDTLEVKRFP